jgi:hypothetical protein
MDMNRSTTMVTAAATVSGLLVAQAALAGQHTWRVNEVFSTPDGSVQFIELVECCGGSREVFLQGLTVDSNKNSFTFPDNLVPPTDNRHILLATQSFADLPGAPTPDYIIDPNFFDPTGDTVSYHVYDSWTFGAVPTNCIDSLHANNPAGPNTPTNYAGQTATGVDACPAKPCPGDIDGCGAVNVDDLLSVISAWGQSGEPGTIPADVNADGTVNVDDLLMVIGNWGDCG